MVTVMIVAFMRTWRFLKRKAGSYWWGDLDLRYRGVHIISFVIFITPLKGKLIITSLTFLIFFFCFFSTPEVL